jgi:ribonuclease BN (tRNA processing enzyme)
LPRYTLLGSGTLLPDEARHSAAHLLEADGVRLLLDCGPGTLHGFGRHGVAWTEITHVAISHYHTDHVGDLSALLFALKWGLRPPRTRELVLIGPAGFRRFVGRLADALGSHILEPGFLVTVLESDPDGTLELGSGLRLSSNPTRHTDESVAYRVDFPGGAFGYTGDTGPLEGLGSFLSGCDILISECAQTDPPELDIHLSPRTVAELASEATPATLVLTHLYPPLTPTEAERLVRAAGYEGPVVAPGDGASFHLGSD